MFEGLFDLWIQNNLAQKVNQIVGSPIRIAQNVFKVKILLACTLIYPIRKLLTEIMFM